MRRAVPCVERKEGCDARKAATKFGVALMLCQHLARSQSLGILPRHLVEEVDVSAVGRPE
jgi:hypothetical protein